MHLWRQVIKVLQAQTGDDVFIGAAGVDTVTTNIGTDVLSYTSSGDDAITIDGSW